MATSVTRIKGNAHVSRRDSTMQSPRPDTWTVNEGVDALGFGRFQSRMSVFVAIGRVSYPSAVGCLQFTR